ncbi:MAG: Hint domain-containing protein [Marinovum sp.]|nr:Hint domain-containing protein [Marinovum sp.]
MPTAQELPIDSSATALEMALEIFGSGATVNNATYFGDPLSSGIYSNGDAVSEEATPGDTGVILSTGHVDDFTNDSGTLNTNTATNTGTNSSGVNGDSQFDALAGGSTFDASILLVEFTPTGDTLTVDFVISSEEYPEFVSSQYLDVIGVWVNGVEATVSVGNGQASVGNINGANTPNLYNDNTSDQFNTEMDGFTVTLTFSAPVNAGATNTLRIGVADVADSGYDTNLLIAGGSVQSSIVALDDSVTIGNNDTTILDVLANDSTTGGTLSITHVNGETVVAGQTIVLGTGQQVTLNANGTFTIQGDSDDETVYFNYSIVDDNGNTDTALVGITQVPCFAAGTLIDTADGPIAVETLRPGIQVPTRDQGLQTIRWVGRRTVSTTGANVPIRIAKGTMGAVRDLVLSSQHRVLIQDVWATLMFGEDEVLVKAKDLINDHSVRPVTDMDEITYVHILFDTHQIVMANGVACESYLPGPATMKQFDRSTQTEIVLLFPELTAGFDHYGPAARSILRTPEAAALAQVLAA